MFIILLSVISASACLQTDIQENQKNHGNQENITFHNENTDQGQEQDTGIISRIDIGAVSTIFSEDWDYNETVLIDTEKMSDYAKNGTLRITLMNENIDIVIQSIDDSKADVIRYKGFVSDSPDYNVDIVLRDKEVYASVTTYDRMYNIFPTNVTSEGKTVHYVTVYNITDSRLEEENYPVDPLTFEIINEDSIEHGFSVEVFDPYNKSIFKETYSLQPGETIQSPQISEQLGRHRYVYSLDNGETYVQYATVDRASGLGSSEMISFSITDDANDPILIGITIA